MPPKRSGSHDSIVELGEKMDEFKRLARVVQIEKELKLFAEEAGENETLFKKHKQLKKEAEELRRRYEAGASGARAGSRPAHAHQPMARHSPEVIEIVDSDDDIAMQGDVAPPAEDLQRPVARTAPLPVVVHKIRAGPSLRTRKRRPSPASPPSESDDWNMDDEDEEYVPTDDGIAYEDATSPPCGSRGGATLAKVLPALTKAELQALKKWKVVNHAHKYNWKKAWSSVPSLVQRMSCKTCIRAFASQRRQYQKGKKHWPY